MMKSYSEDERGKAGSIALRREAEKKVRENKKKLQKSLKKFRDEKIPIVKTQLSEESGLSVATLNRSPYKEMIREYMDEEMALLSPKGAQEIADLIKENRRLKEEIKAWEERYNRLRKEITYSKQLFE